MRLGGYDRRPCHVSPSVSRLSSCRAVTKGGLFFIFRQGPYGGEGDIVVLCAYLGQLARLRDAFADKIAVIIDERDQRELADREAENDDDLAASSVVEHVKVSRRVSRLSQIFLWNIRSNAYVGPPSHYRQLSRRGG